MPPKPWLVPLGYFDTNSRAGTESSGGFHDAVGTTAGTSLLIQGWGVRCWRFVGVFMNLGASLLLLLPLSATIGFTPEPQSAQNQTPRDSSPPVCAVTVPNQSQPPVKNFGGTVTYSPDYKGPRDGPVKDSYGNGKLWTILWSDGTVVFQPDGPGFIDQDGSLSMKWPWYRGVQGRLTIRGKRLDGTAPPLRADIPAGYRDTGFQATALIFPTEGCWEVTGQVGETTLTFVTRVIRLKESK